MPCQSERLLISPCFGRIESVKDLSFMLGIKSITLNGDQNHNFLSYRLPKYQQSHTKALGSHGHFSANENQSKLSENIFSLKK